MSSGSSSVRESSAQFSNGLCATAVMKVQSSNYLFHLLVCLFCIIRKKKLISRFLSDVWLEDPG